MIISNKNTQGVFLRRLWIPSCVMGLIGVLGSFLFLFTSCQNVLSDEDCCPEATIHYRYVRYTEDEYKTFVHSMRHFLFNAEGIYEREIPSNPKDPQNLRLIGTEDTKYTIVTVGNLGDDPLGKNAIITTLKPHETTLKDFRLWLYETKDYRRNTEELFWNFKEIELKETNPPHYICDLANIHCHLFFQVTWVDAPAYDGTYRVDLTGLTESYSLDPKQSPLSLEIYKPNNVVHNFPLHEPALTNHRQEVKLFNHTLSGEFITLRYRADRIPTIQVFYGDEEITMPIDLSKAFAQWGWNPDTRAEQIYRIEIVIKDKNNVTLRPWFDATINDWVNGGSISM